MLISSERPQLGNLEGFGVMEWAATFSDDEARSLEQEGPR